MADIFNEQSLGLELSELNQLALGAQLMNPNSGALHVNDSPASHALTLHPASSRHCTIIAEDCADEETHAA